MRHIKKIALVAAIPFAGAVSCGVDLSGPKLDQNPNIATVARTPGQYLLGIQAATWATQEGGLARTAGIWHQHFAGVDRQYISTDIYSYAEDDYSLEWGFIYAQGGLMDIRKLRAAADKINDKQSSGVAKIYEAWQISTAADIWGDIPYSEANNPAIQTPKLDKQLTVYAALQTLLSSAITDLTGGGPGPGSADLVYRGDVALWTEVAHTLKARLFMHTAEVDPTAYARANTEAKLGISSSANDYLSYHDPVPTSWNVWSQFMYYDRDSYMRAGAALVDTLKNRADPRLDTDCADGNWCAAYYSGGPPWVGSKPGQSLATASTLGDLRLYGPTSDLNFRQPLITWAETQLIIAETAFRAGNLLEAQTALDAVRTASGNTTVIPATLLLIATEKWIADFQNIEVWNDYKRLCLPRLVPAPGKTAIPARLVYPFVERNANPNMPAPSAQPARNQNDPNACP